MAVLRLLFLVCVLGVVVVSTASPSGLSVLNQFSAFTCGNFVSFTADNQGSLAAGGNITLGDYEVGTNLPTNCARFDVSAGGAVKLFNTALNHGSLAYGTTYSNDRSTIACSTVKNPTILPYSQMCSALSSDSQQLGATKPNSPTIVNFSDLILNGTNVGNNIFSVTSAQLANARSIHISVPLDAWATINIAGTAPITFGNTNIVLSSSTVLEKVLFNFYQTSRLNMFAISVPGSLVAINAAVQFDNGNIDGSIASLSFNGTGEIHLHPYVPPTCNCTVCPPQYQLPPWSIFALTNVNQTDTDDEGNFAIGGNAYLTNYAVGSALPQFGPPVDMVVGGDLHFSVGQVFRGSILVGGIATTNNVGIPDGQLYQKATIPINFQAVFQQLNKFARSLSQMAATGSASFTGNTITFAGTSTTLNVFNAPSNITSYSGFSIVAPANAWVVINFAGSSGSLTNGNINLSGGVSYETVILNFFEAKLLTIESISVSGGVLAPNAAVTFNNGNINGCLWVDSIQGTGETHYYPPPPFTPDCPPCSC